MKRSLTLLLLSGLTLTMVACSTSNETGKNTTSNTQSSVHDEVNYDNQESWDFTSGDMQSPIDIKTDVVEKMSEDVGTIKVDYSPSISKAENNGHSIQVTDSGSAEINGRHFNLSQFHFHAASEHTIDGKHYPLEAHFVNVAQSGRIAVIGVFFKEGKENIGFQEVLDDVTDKKDAPITDIGEMLPTNTSYYHYLGSLTTPPLSENVEWYVMKEPVEVSATQIESFKKLYDHNNREIQELNGRKIIEHND